jgi:hypothetical protein
MLGNYIPESYTSAIDMYILFIHSQTVLSSSLSTSAIIASVSVIHIGIRASNT